MLHTKCRGVGLCYPRTENKIRRFDVPDDKVLWSIPFPEYKPVEYTAPYILKGQSWADPVDAADLSDAWNKNDGVVNRVSFCGAYDITVEQRPLNPFGRTGITGRGCLGRWGPNHAADPIVTRWKRNVIGVRMNHPETSHPILQFVAILRSDCGEWALPGGMVDPGEVVSDTLYREFTEEALSQNEIRRVKQLFDCGGTEVYTGYVDDPRNTDNAWMETVACNFHDEKGRIFQNVKLNAGDDAVGAHWVDVNRDLNLYASHKSLVKKVADLIQAHW